MKTFHQIDCGNGHTSLWIRYSWFFSVGELYFNIVGKIRWRKEWLPTPVFWPGEFHRLYSPWGCKESDTTERLSLKVVLTNAMLLLLSCLVVSDSLWPHGPQHARPPWPSPSNGVSPRSRPLHQWCHSAISSSEALFSFCPQSFPTSGTFPMSWLFT